MRKMKFDNLLEYTEELLDMLGRVDNLLKQTDYSVVILKSLLTTAEQTLRDDLDRYISNKDWEGAKEVIDALNSFELAMEHAEISQGINDMRDQIEELLSISLKKIVDKEEAEHMAKQFEEEK